MWGKGASGCWWTKLDPNSTKLHWEGGARRQSRPDEKRYVFTDDWPFDIPLVILLSGLLLFDLVHMLAPVGLKASAIHARNVSVQWRWTVQQYHHLNITCQLNVSYGEINEIVSWPKKDISKLLECYFMTVFMTMLLDSGLWSWPSVCSFD